MDRRYVGIDLHRRRSVIYAMDGQGERACAFHHSSSCAVSLRDLWGHGTLRRGDHRQPRRRAITVAAAMRPTEGAGARGARAAPKHGGDAGEGADSQRRVLVCRFARVRVRATFARVPAPRRALAARLALLRFRVLAPLRAAWLRVRSRLSTLFRISSAADVRCSTVWRASFSPATPERRPLPSSAARDLAVFLRSPCDRSTSKNFVRTWPWESPGGRIARSDFPGVPD